MTSYVNPIKNNIFFILLSVVGCINRENHPPIANPPLGNTCVSDYFKRYPISIGNPDTSLAVFLWNDTTNLDYNDYVEEYTYFYTQDEKILEIIESIYFRCPNLKEKVEYIKGKKSQFRSFVISKVLDEQEQFGGVSESPALDFLIKIKDKTVNKLTITK